MKKLLLVTAVAVFGFTSVNAQDEKTGGYSNGDVFATGSVSFSSSTSEDYNSDAFRFNPSVGYFVSDNVAVGVSLGIETRKQDYSFSSEVKTNAFTAGAFGQYYFTPENQFSFLLQLSALYTSFKQEQSSNEAKGDGFIAGFAPGINYFVSDCFALQANVGVLSYQTEKIDGISESSDGFSIGLNLTDINFGLTYKFK